MKLLELLGAVQKIGRFPRVRLWSVIQPFHEVLEFVVTGPRIQNIFNVEFFFIINHFKLYFEFRFL